MTDKYKKIHAQYRNEEHMWDINLNGIALHIPKQGQTHSHYF